MHMDKLPLQHSSLDKVKPTLVWSILQMTLISGFFLFLDQWSKALAEHFFQQSVGLFPWAKFQLGKNYGIAFSIDIPSQILLPLNFLIFMVLIGVLLQKVRLTHFLSIFIIALLSAGALGNLLDRFNFGFVRDFISIGNFPVFNLADSYITVSVFLLFLFYDKIKRSN